MEMTSDHQKPSYEIFGDSIRVYLNEQENPATEDTDLSWSYCEIRFNKNISRDERVEEIIKARYPTYGSELAAINNGGDEYQDYLSFRREAKDLVDSIVE